jgi:maternal-effect protein exuperantia
MAEVANKNETGKQATTAKVTTEPLPPGDYKLVAVGLDFTGRSMADEIINIGAYTIKDNKPKTYGQYIMPYRNIGNASQRAHGVRVYTTFSAYRGLYDIRTGRVLRTMSEYATLNAFMEWLEAVKGDSKGIILIHHGNTIDNMMPQLLQALDRYKMTDAFYGIIHGCVNLKNIGTDHPQMNERSLSMISFLRRVLEFGDDKMKLNSLQRANHRAELTYKIAMKIFNLPDETDVSTGPLASCLTKDQEREIMVAQQISSDKIRSLRPIFIKRMRGANFKERSRATLLRRYLIDLGIDYDTLKAAHTSASKDGIVKLVVIDDPKATPKKKQDLEELVDVIFAHFEKTDGPRDINANKIERGQGESAGKGKGKGKGKPRPPVDEDDDDEDDEEFEDPQGEK